MIGCDEIIYICFTSRGRNLWFRHIYGSKDISWLRSESPENFSLREPMLFLNHLWLPMVSRKRWRKLVRIIHKSTPAHWYRFIRRSEWGRIYEQQIVFNAGKMDLFPLRANIGSWRNLQKERSGPFRPYKSAPRNDSHYWILSRQETNK
jgi:hypothetical protein